jgi:CRISPR-associated endoribonuclease Cas6
MRLLVTLQCQADTTYDNTYHQDTRNRLWKGLRNTKYDELHDNHGSPQPFTFSNVFPTDENKEIFSDPEEGEIRQFLIASPYEDLLSILAQYLMGNEIHIGHMPFDVLRLQELSPDVGEPGTRGVLRTATGVLSCIPPQYFDEFGIESEHEQVEYWTPDNPLEAFVDHIELNLQDKHDEYGADYRPGPRDTEYSLFDSFDFIKEFAIPLSPASGFSSPRVLTKWNFEYVVRDDTHRRHLNLALDVGIGRRNSMGLGFLNIESGSKESPGITGESHAHA